MSNQIKENNKFINYTLSFISVSISISISQSLVAPLDRVKIIRQTQDIHPKIQSGEINKYEGIINILKRIPKEDGFLSLWRGNLPSILRQAPTKALQFPVKDFYKKLLPKYDPKDNPLKFFVMNILSGSLAGATTLSIVYPFDLVRAKLASDLGIGESRQFSGMVDCFSKTYNQAGRKGLYAGYLTSVVGIASYRGLYFGLYDTSKGLGLGNQSKILKFIGATTITTLTGLITYPFDTIIQRLRIQSGGNQFYEGGLDCFSKVIQQEGLTGLFKGYGVNLVKQFGSVILLVLYDEIFPETKKE